MTLGKWDASLLRPLGTECSTGKENNEHANLVNACQAKRPEQ